MVSRRKQRDASSEGRAPAEDGTSERLQKVLAAAGVASRRECEELIAQGRVEVDGQVVAEMGVSVNPAKQRIRVDGVTVRFPRRVYFLVNKPPGVVCTNYDPSGRPRVIDLVRTTERVFPVGRLDRSSEGLILVTNDGELSNRLTHPRYGILKTYRVRVAGCPSAEVMASLRRGIHLAEGVARVSFIKVRGRQRGSTDLEIGLREGRNREIRRILARVGHRVLTLRRVAIGPLKIGRLPRGGYRALTREEVRQLQHAVRRGAQGGEKATESASKKGRVSRPSQARRKKTPAAPKRAGRKKTGGRSSKRRTRE